MEKSVKGSFFVKYVRTLADYYSPLYAVSQCDPRSGLMPALNHDARIRQIVKVMLLQEC